MHFGEYELFPSLIGLSPLPTVHPKTFQRLLVRSSSQFYLTFNLTMGRSQGFASSAIDLFALFRLAFASAAPLKGLTLPMTTNSQAHYAKGTPSSRQGGTPTACRRTVSGTISLPCSGCFSPFPHGTSSLSVSQEYLALPDGPGRFRQDFTCPALLRIPLSLILLRVRGYHPLWPDFPDGSTSNQFNSCGPTTPALPKQHWFGLLPFRSPLLWESLLFSLPPVNEMFQFTGFASCMTGYLLLDGLSHSEINGSIGICPSPSLIAAYHVLLRL